MTSLALPPGSMIFFIDETGDPSFRDPVHPMFAWAGCGMRAEEYAVVRAAWRTLRSRLWPGRVRPLHASRLRNLSRKAAGRAMAEFFRAHAFARLAVIGGASTDFGSRFEPLAVLAGALRKRIDALARAAPTAHVAVIFESSARDADVVETYFGSLVPHFASRGIAVDLGFMDKQLCEPGMEIADVIAHTAGRHARRGEGDRDVDSLIDAVLRPPSGDVLYVNVQQVGETAQ